jgi:hypothetical protein
MTREEQQSFLRATRIFIDEQIAKACTPLKERIAILEDTLVEFGFKGQWAEGIVYRSGNFVTLGGSLWHCDVQVTTNRPTTDCKDWSLAVKRGRDAPKEPRRPTAPRMVGHNHG